MAYVRSFFSSCLFWVGSSAHSLNGKSYGRPCDEIDTKPIFFSSYSADWSPLQSWHQSTRAIPIGRDVVIGHPASRRMESNCQLMEIVIFFWALKLTEWSMYRFWKGHMNDLLDDWNHSSWLLLTFVVPLTSDGFIHSGWVTILVKFAERSVWYACNTWMYWKQI